MAKLRLGPIPDDKLVKRTVALPAALDADLVAYAKMHASEIGGPELPIEKLIPPMLERFIRTDREFLRARRKRG